MASPLRLIELKSMFRLSESLMNFRFALLGMSIFVAALFIAAFITVFADESYSRAG